MSETDSSWILDTNDDAFERDVLERSRELPVLLDFWGTYCQPCRMLTPVLEKLAREFKGRFLLVKAEVGETAKAAHRYQVSGVPTVLAVVDGEPVDFFQGFLPEPQARAWIDRLLGAIGLLRAEAQEGSDPAAAEAGYRSYLAEQQENSRALIGLARTRLAQEDAAEAREILTILEERGYLEPEAERLKAALDLGQRSGLNLAACRAAAEKDPKDLSLQLRLAEALAGSQEYQEAFDICLQLVESDREATGEEARKLMLELFQVIDDSELVNDYRRKLSMLLF